ncbi:MAG: phosphohistidine phosphatase SixA, partial [Clostridiales bacterium]|nr:phosphohistidine phosphatase SixA [Clostridiales bacterium]
MLQLFKVQFDLIVSSPYVRALGTAQILQKNLGLKKDQVIVSENLAPL